MSNTGYSIRTNGDINLMTLEENKNININAKSCNMNASVFFNDNVEFNGETVFSNVLDKLTGISSTTPQHGDTFVYGNSGSFITTKNGVYISPLLISESITISGNYNIYNVNTESNEVIITLPQISPFIPYNISIIDINGTAGTNNITINVNDEGTETINGIYTSVKLNINYSVLKLTAVLENKWIIS